MLAEVCGYLGPRPNPHSGPNRSKGLKGKRPRHRLASECRADPPDVARGISSDISRPMSARLIFRPGAWGFHSPDGLLSSDVYFPERQFSQAKLPAGFLSYKRKFTHKLTSSLRRNRKALSIVSLFGKQLYTRETNPTL